MPIQANQKFPLGSENGPVEMPRYQGLPKNQPPPVSPNEPLQKDGYLFPPLYNSVLVEGTSEV